MKIFVITLFFLAVIIIGFNIYLIDFSNPLGEKSFVALISAGVAMIALLLLLAFYMAKKIQNKVKNKQTN